jgi:hypothetical protein
MSSLVTSTKFPSRQTLLSEQLTLQQALTLTQDVGTSRTEPHNTPQRITEKEAVPIVYSLHSFVLQQKTTRPLFTALLNDASELSQLFRVEW